MAKPHTANSSDFSPIQRQLTEWRSSQPKRSRLPEPLWDAIIQLAQKHGAHRTSKALGVDYVSLRRRLSQQPTPSPSIPAAFVELTPTPAGGAGCVIELLRIESHTNVDWTQLLSAWRRQRGA
jgi:hypothetical protein